MDEQARIEALRQKYGITPMPTKAPGVDARLSELDSAWGATPEAPVEDNSIQMTKGLGLDFGGPGVGVIDATGPVIDAGKRIFENVKGNIKEGGDAYRKSLDGEMNPIQAGAQIFKNTASAVASPITETVGKVVEKAAPVLQPFIDSINDSDSVVAFTDFLSKYPKVADTLYNVVSGGLDISAVQGMVKAPEAVDAVRTSVTDAVSAAKQKAVDLKAKVSSGKPNSLEVLQEKLAPKPTAKEARLAMDQGRLYPKQDGTLLKEGKPGRIAASEQQARSAQTTERLIPDAAKLDEATLYTEMKGKIGDLSKELKPEMQKVEIKPETIQKINDEWTNLKKTQKAEAKATDEPNVAKWQANFERHLQKSKNGTMDDLWEARQAYDDSIKSNVKNATEQSPEDLQIQKDIWLENRRILTDAINDPQNGLGKTSQNAFSDMRDLYEGMNGLLTKAKVDVTVEPSKLQRVLRTGIKAVVGERIMKATTGLGF